jgi:hypothetical protein
MLHAQILPRRAAAGAQNLSAGAPPPRNRRHDSTVPSGTVFA